MSIEQLKEELFLAPKNGFKTLTPEQREEMEAYCKRYSAFMDACKTEREATTWAVNAAEKEGFKPLVPGMELKPGDKVY
ncbi:MAG: aminopeptidase, partial [Oscillospiraceae bacterium]|nr:aminopeptidase [Oscillospiraceae bacterium]